MTVDKEANDYAVAKSLNDHVSNLLFTLKSYQLIGPRDDFDNNELNELYILLVDELQKIYSRNSNLANIKPEPVWKHVDIIDSIYDISKWLEDNDDSKAHIARVEKYCILSGKRKPDYSEEQKNLISFADKINTKYFKMIVEEIEKLPKTEPEPDYKIIKYTLAYKPDGTILINDVLKLKKVHAGSTTERLLEQAIKQPNVLFKPDLGQTSRNLSTILSSAGLTPVLRSLFFPTVSNNKGVIFRPEVTSEQAQSEHIDTAELDKELIRLIIPEYTDDDLEYVGTLR